MACPALGAHNVRPLVSCAETFLVNRVKDPPRETGFGGAIEIPMWLAIVSISAMSCDEIRMVAPSAIIQQYFYEFISHQRIEPREGFIQDDQSSILGWRTPV